MPLKLKRDVVVRSKFLTRKDASTGEIISVIAPNGLQIGLSGSTSVTGEFVSYGNSRFYEGLSGSLTQLVDGTSYLVAGSNVTISSASNGAVTISSAGGGSGSPGGSDGNVQFNNAGSFGGENDFTYDDATNDLVLSGTINVLTASVRSTDFAGSVNLVAASDLATDLTFTLPEADGSKFQLMRTDGSGILSFDFADRVEFRVRNESGATLEPGTPVYITGYNSGNDRVTIAAASASNPSTMPAAGIISNQLANNSNGKAMALGFLEGVDTSGFSVGDVLYVGSNGFLQNTKPSAFTDLIQNIGKVFKSATNGAMNVKSPGRTNDVPNIVSASGGFSGSLTRLGDGTSYLIAGSNVTISSTSNGPVTISSTQASPAGADTQVQFNDGGSFGASSAFTFSGTEIGLHAADPVISIRRTNNNQDSIVTFKGAGGAEGARLTFGDNSTNDLVLGTYAGTSVKDRLRIRSNTTDVAIEATGSVRISDDLTIDTVVNAGTDTDKFLVLDASNKVDFRTGAEVRSDIGAGTGDGTVGGTGAAGRVAYWSSTTDIDDDAGFLFSTADDKMTLGAGTGGALARLHVNNSSTGSIQFLRGGGATLSAELHNDANQDLILVNSSSAADIVFKTTSGKAIFDTEVFGSTGQSGSVHVTGSASSATTQAKLAVGCSSDTPPKTAIDVTFDYSTHPFENQLSNGEGGGLRFRFGSYNTSVSVVGKLCYLVNTTWVSVAANNATAKDNLIAVALDKDAGADEGLVLLQGFVRIPSSLVNGTPAGGAPVYADNSNAGEYTATLPSTSGDVVRVVGYWVDSSGSDYLIYFNPDQTYVEVS